MEIGKHESLGSVAVVRLHQGLTGRVVREREGVQSVIRISRRWGEEKIE